MTDKDIEKQKHQEDEIVEETIKIFQKRARNNKTKAVLSLVGIVLTLFVTVVIFYFASSLTAKDIDVFTGKKSDLLIVTYTSVIPFSIQNSTPYCTVVLSTIGSMSLFDPYLEDLPAASIIAFLIILYNLFLIR